MTVIVRGTVALTRHARMYVPSTVKVSEPSGGCAAHFNSSILSYKSAVATDIWRLPIFARTANEKMAATATSPHATIAAVTSASIRVNPRLRLKGKGPGSGRAVTTLLSGREKIKRKFLKNAPLACEPYPRLIGLHIKRLHHPARSPQTAYPFRGRSVLRSGRCGPGRSFGPATGPAPCHAS